jgi:hypothetical protein
MAPDAPAVLSTNICCPNIFCIEPAKSRVMVSPGPPAAYGITMVMGLTGNSWADTQLAAPRSKAPNTLQSLACMAPVGMEVNFMVRVLWNSVKNELI